VRTVALGAIPGSQDREPFDKLRPGTGPAGRGAIETKATLFGFGVVAGAQIAAETYGAETGSGYDEAEDGSWVFRRVVAAIDLGMRADGCDEDEQDKGKDGPDLFQLNLQILNVAVLQTWAGTDTLVTTGRWGN
jgi:hypothetical protein